MTTKERLHALVDELSEQEADEAFEYIVSRLERTSSVAAASENGVTDEPDDAMAPLPEGWGETLTGEPMPNVVAAVRRSREGH